MDEYADRAWFFLTRLLPPPSSKWPDWARGCLEHASMRADENQHAEAALQTLLSIVERTRAEAATRAAAVAPHTRSRPALIPYVLISRGRKRPRQSTTIEDPESSPQSSPPPSSSAPRTQPVTPRVPPRVAQPLAKKANMAPSAPPAAADATEEPKRKKKKGGVAAANDDAPQILANYEVSVSRAPARCPLMCLPAIRPLRVLHSWGETLHPRARSSMH